MISGNGRGIGPYEIQEPVIEQSPCPTCGEHTIFRIRRSLMVPTQVISPPGPKSPGQIHGERRGLSMVGRCISCGRWEYHLPDAVDRTWKLVASGESWSKVEAPASSDHTAS